MFWLSVAYSLAFFVIFIQVFLSEFFRRYRSSFAYASHKHIQVQIMFSAESAQKQYTLSQAHINCVLKEVIVLVFDRYLTERVVSLIVLNIGVIVPGTVQSHIGHEMGLQSNC